MSVTCFSEENLRADAPTGDVIVFQGPVASRDTLLRLCFVWECDVMIVWQEVEQLT